MSYRIAMSVRHSITGEVARVVWPENQDEMEIPSGHLDDERPTIDKIRVWRELGDDIEVIGGKADLSALPLTDALACRR